MVFIHLFMNILVASSFLWLWIKLLQIFTCRFFCVNTFQIGWGIPMSLLLKPHGKTMANLGKSCQTVFQRGCTSLQFYCSASLTAFGAVSVLHFTCSNKCIVVSCCLTLKFVSDELCWTLFKMFTGHLYICFNNMFN